MLDIVIYILNFKYSKLMPNERALILYLTQIKYKLKPNKAQFEDVFYYPESISKYLMIFERSLLNEKKKYLYYFYMLSSNHFFI